MCGVQSGRLPVIQGDAVDPHCPEAERIVLVLDRRNTHSSASLFAAFPPAEAQRLADKLELHYTSKHGSWRTMAELELSALKRQCPRQRLPDLNRARAGHNDGENNVQGRDNG